MNESLLIKTHLIKSSKELYCKLPHKLSTAVNSVIPSKLKAIHKDKAVAKEAIRYVLSFLKATYLEDDVDHVHLHHEMLIELLRPIPYMRIIEACLEGGKDGPFIERDPKGYVKGSHSIPYWFAPRYQFKNPKFPGNYLIKYKFKTDEIKAIYLRNLTKMVSTVLDAKGNLLASQEAHDSEVDPLIINALNFYQMLDPLPTPEYLMKRGKELVAAGFRTKKQKLLVMRNGNPDHRFSQKYDLEKISCVEDCISKFLSLVDGGFMFPKSQGPRGGFRLTEFYPLTPGWIADEITIAGEKLIEFDYKCLHPNNAMTIYGGDMKFITHEQIAARFGIDVKEIKQEHLAFLNKHPNDMKRSGKIYHFYLTEEPFALKRLIADKCCDGKDQLQKYDRKKYAYTSRLMLKKETDIIRDVVRKLNVMGIYVGYRYDAVRCKPQHAEIVEQVMNETVLAHGVFTATFDMNKRVPAPTAAERLVKNEAQQEKLRRYIQSEAHPENEIHERLEELEYEAAILHEMVYDEEVLGMLPAEPSEAPQKCAQIHPEGQDSGDTSTPRETRQIRLSTASESEDDDDAFSMLVDNEDIGLLNLEKNRATQAGLRRCLEQHRYAGRVPEIKAKLRALENEESIMRMELLLQFF